jgi:hydrogenase maturation factor
MPKERDTPHSLKTLSEVVELTGLEITKLTRMVRNGDLPAATKLPGKTGAYLIEESVAIKLAEQIAADAEDRARNVRSAIAEGLAS